MIGVDTNILVYAHRADSPWHEAASEVVRSLAEGPAPWAIPWPCIHEFWSIVTHPRIYDPPTSGDDASAQVDAWLGSPSLVLLSECESHWRTIRGLLSSGRIVGPAVHDARIASISIDSGVRELWTADRDFSRFSGLATRNPLIP